MGGQPRRDPNPTPVVEDYQIAFFRDNILPADRKPPGYVVFCGIVLSSYVSSTALKENGFNHEGHEVSRRTSLVLFPASEVALANTPFRT